jgi:two-component system chemotaxis sensor kinase CheA
VDSPFAELLDEYVAECLPLAERVGETFVALEQRWEAGESGEELIGPLKGTLHTLKGNSAMMGLTPIQSLAHALEDICARLDGEATRPAAGGLLVRGGALLVDLIRRAKNDPGGSERSEAFVAEARAFLSTTDSTGSAKLPDRRKTDRRTAAAGELGADGVVTTIRVDARRLDALLESFGETMIAGAGLRESVRIVARQQRNLPGMSDVEHALVMLEKTLNRLEGALMETRLLPITTVFGRFTLLAREVAHGERKRVRLVTSGGETRLDKTVLDRLSEPLVHLVTNAIIHGIETPAERERAGKPHEAVVSLVASQRSDRVILTVSDDGRGLDADRLLVKARELGAVPGNTTPPRDEILALAFLPGLSTTDRVSSLAGRGVGLDVVANSVRALGGGIEVASEPGRGTAFTLRLPLTLAVLRALLVSVDGEQYAVPLGDVAESLRVTPDVLHELHGRGMMLWRGQVLSVADAGALLGSAAQPGPRNYCVVVRTGGKRRGLLVDSLLGHQDVVVKALDPSLGRPPIISGATILGDGRVACILDTARFAEWRGLDPAPALASA